MFISNNQDAKCRFYPHTAAGSPCQFDEGGPLIQADADGKSIVVGIMSKTKSCALDAPGVYTRVSVYYSWLLTVAGPQAYTP